MFTLVVSANVSYDGALFGFWNLKLEFTNISLFFGISNLSLLRNRLRFCVLLYWFSKRVNFG